MGNKLDLTGQRFGKLTVLRRGKDHVQPSGQKKTTWVCVCDCDPSKEIVVTTNNLRSGSAHSCGCLKYETKDYVGYQFGRWTVLYRADSYCSPSGYQIQKWHCRCMCGTERDVLQSSLVTGNSLSCGCLQIENSTANNIDLTNRRFGKWTVLREAEPYVSSSGKPMRKWLCRCDCGKERNVMQEALCTGASQSCGCTKKQRIKDTQNKFDLSGTYGIGYTSEGITYLFDKDDYNLIKDYGWQLDNHGYISASYKKKALRLHRLIMHINDKNVIIDHINHDKCDNRKCNLRIADAYLNSLNARTPINNTSGYKGVHFNKQKNKWQARITVKGKVMHLGFFNNAEDAAKARREAEEKYFGQFSFDNSMRTAKAYHIEGVTNAQS